MHFQLAGIFGFRWGFLDIARLWVTEPLWACSMKGQQTVDTKKGVVYYLFWMRQGCRQGSFFREWKDREGRGRAWSCLKTTMAWQSWQEIGIQESGSFLWVIQANWRAEFERVAGENRREHKKASGYSLYLGVRTCSLGVVGRAEGCWDISPCVSWDIREKRREYRLLCALSPSSSQLSAPEPCYRSFTPSLGCALYVRANTSQVLLNKNSLRSINITMKIPIHS